MKVGSRQPFDRRWRGFGRLAETSRLRIRNGDGRPLGRNLGARSRTDSYGCCQWCSNTAAGLLALWGWRTPPRPGKLLPASQRFPRQQACDHLGMARRGCDDVVRRGGGGRTKPAKPTVGSREPRRSSDVERAGNQKPSLAEHPGKAWCGLEFSSCRATASWYAGLAC